VQYSTVVYRQGARLVISLTYVGYVMSEMSQATLYLVRKINSYNWKGIVLHLGATRGM